MTGLINFDEGDISINILVDEFKKISGKLFMPLKNIDNEEKKLECVSCNQQFTHYVMLKTSCNHLICKSCSNKKVDNCPKCSHNLVVDAVNKTECKVRKYSIVLINSDYKAGFEIRRDILHQILVNKYSIFSSFEPCIYPGVNTKFFWNINYLDDTNMIPGKCVCSKLCNGKGRGNGNGDCKQITISIFQSGSVIITGARSMEQINCAYKFINNVFKTHYNSIKKIKPAFIKDNDVENKKQKTKHKKIKISINSIQNYPSNSTIKYIQENYSKI